ncbi:hypothetical protein [Haladaptatus sp. R4]|uniref:hypothetical protein n=1 Tax=Haladaptatus sp. R4 TaxID=1679489 RepID=UPI000B21A8E3|nr:hypothetical protein [Haladaptatus sp. R4]
MPRTRDSVRQADFSSLPVENSIQDVSDEIELYDVNTISIEVYLEDSEEYPFEEPKKTEGKFKYEYSDQLGTETASGTFQLRHSSQLFVVRKESGTARLDRIVSVLNNSLDDALESDVTIHNRFRPTREGIWTFIENATWRNYVEILTDLGEEKRVSEYCEETGKSFESIVGRYPILRAEFVLELPWNDSVDVVYDQGHLEISTDNIEDYEYVLQRFETDVFSN